MNGETLLKSVKASIIKVALIKNGYSCSLVYNYINCIITTIFFMLTLRGGGGGGVVFS